MGQFWRLVARFCLLKVGHCQEEGFSKGKVHFCDPPTYIKLSLYVRKPKTKNQIFISKNWPTAPYYCTLSISSIIAWQLCESSTFTLRYESSSLILNKELSSPIFQSCQSVSEWVSKAFVTPVQLVMHNACFFQNGYSPTLKGTTRVVNVLSRYPYRFLAKTFIPIVFWVFLT